LRSARDELMQAFSAAGQQFYQAQAAAEQAAQEPAGETADATAGAGRSDSRANEDVVEADYEIVDDEK
jgi:hypothetical protein